jgi:hypothetical protein
MLSDLILLVKEFSSFSVITMKKKTIMGPSLKKRYTFIIGLHIKSYHNKLKPHYFGRIRITRVDGMIYILLQIVSFTISKILYIFNLV